MEQPEWKRLVEKEGFEVVSETKEDVTLKYEEEFDWTLFILLLIFGVIGGIVYLIYGWLVSNEIQVTLPKHYKKSEKKVK